MDFCRLVYYETSNIAKSISNEDPLKSVLDDSESVSDDKFVDDPGSVMSGSSIESTILLAAWSGISASLR